MILQVLLQGRRHEDESASEDAAEEEEELEEELKELLAMVIDKQVCMSHLMSLWQPLHCSFATDVLAPITAFDCILTSRSWLYSNGRSMHPQCLVLVGIVVMNTPCCVIKGNGSSCIHSGIWRRQAQ